MRILALTEANELEALEYEAMLYFPEEKEREEQLKRTSENQRRPFHEVRHPHTQWPCITNMYTHMPTSVDYHDQRKTEEEKCGEMCPR